MEKSISHSKSLKNLNTLKSKAIFLASLLYKPSFYKVLNEVFTDPSKLDLTLGTACYSTLLASALVKKHPTLKSQFIKIWIKVLIALNRLLEIFSNVTNIKTGKLSLPNKSENEVSKTDKQEEEEEKRLNTISSTLKNFSGYITDIRIFQRGFTIPTAIIDILESGSFLKNKDYLNFISTISISVYQPLETIAFLFDHEWIKLSKEPNVNWWYAVSTRFWFFWVIAEFAQLFYKISIKQRCKYVKKDEIITFLEHLATLPLCVHWSLEDGCLNDFNVGLFGTLAGGISTVDMWIDLWKKILKECK